MNKCDYHFDNGRYPIIQDLQGKANVFFQYQCILVDLVGSIRKLKLGMGDAKEIKQEITEKMRFALVNAMRGNQKICIYVGAESVDLSEFSDPKEFPMQMLFDYEEGRKHDNYVGIVHDDEKYDNVSRVVDGHFFAADKFGIVVLTDSPNPADVELLIKGLPHEKMGKFVM